ncbi:MAG: cytochrome c biogenesis protein CcdA [Natronospirillum sp.]
MIEIANISLIAAFLAGLISFVSPCVLPLVPGYLSFVAGRPLNEMRAAQPLDRFLIMGRATWFVFGFSTIFLMLGASATAIGGLLLTYRQQTNLLGGVIVIVFGLFMTGLLRIPRLQQEWRFLHKIPQRTGRPVASYLLGVAFAFGWTPCIGPILGAILTLGASQANMAGALTLLGVYSLGLGVPFLLSALSINSLLNKGVVFRRWGRTLNFSAGAIMIVMGVLIISGQLSAFSYWLLATFPVLGTIG